MAEGLDRLSRDQEHTAGLFKQLAFAGVRLVTVAEGEIGELHVGLKGTMNALYLKDLAQKTHRGLRGRVEQGRSGGGRCYGYARGARAGRRDGLPERGRRQIEPAEAAIVRRIFQEYAAGQFAKAIAQALNREGIPGPHGGAWGPSTIARQCRPRHRHPQQRALCRPAGLEPAALRQGPQHRQAGVAAERRGQRIVVGTCPSCGSSTRSSGRQVKARQAR